MKRIVLTGMMALATAGCQCGTTPVQASRQATVVVRSESFHVAVAATPEAWQRGLQEVEEIPANGGMLFVYPDAQERHFWMVGCRNDIDIAFIDDNARVVSRFTMKAEPPRRPGEDEEAYHGRLPLFSSQLPARYALEVKAGTWKRLGLVPGEIVEIRWK